jgi:hypothetical protein
MLADSAFREAQIAVLILAGVNPPLDAQAVVDGAIACSVRVEPKRERELSEP